MRLLHTSDLHIGRRMNGYSLIEDQKHILEEILQIAKDKKVDVLLIAGDVYDRHIPSEEAVTLFDGFITALANEGIPAMVTSGNHDSAERVGFGSHLMDAMQVFVSPAYRGNTKKVVLEDRHGRVNFWLLPFVKPQLVRSVFQQDDIEDYTQAIARTVEEMNPDFNERNVILSHQFVAGSVRTESETVSVGGMDNVAPSAYTGFDYVALGHIHRPQRAGAEHIRYCGSPLKYSFDNNEGQKSVLMVDLEEKGNVNIEKLPLHPVRDMREIRGSFDQLIQMAEQDTVGSKDYISVVITDEHEKYDGFQRLKDVYPNLMQMRYDNRRMAFDQQVDNLTADAGKTTYEYCQELFEKQNNGEMSEFQNRILMQIIDEVKGEI